MAEPTHGYLINSGGETVRVPLEQVPQAQQLGWVPASQQQVDDYKLQQQYGTPGEQAKTFLEALGDVATFGGSTAAEVASGVKPEAIEGRAKANPLVHGAGTVAAFVPAALSGVGEAEGALGAARAVAEGAPGLLSKAGQAVGEGAEALARRGLAGAAEGPLTRGATYASKVVGELASGAVQGAGYGTGQVVHEAALGNPNLTVGNAMEEIGLSGLLGGALGAGGGVLAQLTKEASASQLGQKLADWLPEFEGERNLKAAGAIQSDITRATKRMSQEQLNAIGREAGELGLVDAFSTPSKTLERSRALMDSAGSDMGDILQAADVAEGSAPPQSAHLLARARNEILKELQANPYEAAAASRFEDTLNRLGDKLGSADPESSIGFKALHGERKLLDDTLYGLRGEKVPGSDAYKEALQDLRGIFSDEIQKGIDASGLDSAAWKAANRRYQVGATVAKFAEKGLARSVGNNLVSPTEMLSGLTGFATHGVPGGALLGLGTALVRRHAAGALGAGARVLRNYLSEGGAEELAGKTAEAIAAERQAGADTIASTAPTAHETVAALSQLQAVNQRVADRVDKLADALVTGTKLVKSAAASESSHLADEAILERAHQLASNPQALQAVLEQQTGDLHEHAPNTSQAFSLAASRAVAHLHNNFPPLQKPGPLAPQPKRSQADRWRLKETVGAMQRPSDLLKLAVVGKLTPLHLNVVRDVHPERLAQMQSALLDKLAEHGDKAIPYKSKLGLSMLVGQSLDGTTSQQAIAANQLIYQLPSAKGPDSQTGPGAMRPTQTGLGKLTVANRAMLPGQAADNRRGEA